MKLGAPAGGGGGGGGGGGELPLPLPWRLRRSGGGYGRRLLVLIVLVCCSPILVPLVCLSLPFVLIIFLCIRSERSDAEAEQPEDFVDRSKKEEEEKKNIGGESFILHRYLEDQMKLVLESVAVPQQDTITL